MSDDRYAQTRAMLAQLEQELGQRLVLGYIGTVAPWGDDRLWSVDFPDLAVPKSATEGRGPWSHRASGMSYPAILGWRTADWPPVETLAAVIRRRYQREIEARS